MRQHNAQHMAAMFGKHCSNSAAGRILPGFSKARHARAMQPDSEAKMHTAASTCTCTLAGMQQQRQWWSLGQASAWHCRLRPICMGPHGLGAPFLSLLASETCNEAAMAQHATQRQSQLAVQQLVSGGGIGDRQAACNASTASTLCLRPATC